MYERPCVILIIIATVCTLCRSQRSFGIDFDRNTFVKDGKPFQYVSGSVHMYRMPRAYWADRLQRMWTAGLNAIQTYVFWDQHELVEGVYNFEDNNDLVAFIQLAQKIGFVVILRVGPYGCGEHEFGGFPWWLLRDLNNLEFRQMNTVYLKAVTRWMSVLLPQIRPLLYNNGGSVISVQVENEYGSYPACDHNYMGYLRDVFRQYLGDNLVLFTVDGNGLGYLRCGTVKGAYTTIDFGPGTNVNESFNYQRQYAPHGPLVNTEFYPGWLDLWGHQHSTVSTESIVKTLDEMLSIGVNVNFYMFFGGTNFGFTSGADPDYIPQPTSYDYDAPISEPGDITSKYMAIRNVIGKYLPLPSAPVPGNNTKKAYGSVRLSFKQSLLSYITSHSPFCTTSSYPKRFEELGQNQAFVVYSTILNNPEVQGKVLDLSGVRDRAYVLLGEKSIGIAYRANSSSLKLTIQAPGNRETHLNIIVENMGRLNYGGDLFDTKGFVNNITLDGQLLVNWTMCISGSLFDEAPTVFTMNKFEDFDPNAPNIYTGNFSVTDQAPSDTFLLPTTISNGYWEKGVAYINKYNLGRYWPILGPQVTLYIPSPWLIPSTTNSLTMIELQSSPCGNQQTCSIELVDYPILDKPTLMPAPLLYKRKPQYH
ncbi:unnamed protein product [Rotaria socialis]|uniref:Beta-galactosidase n=1 Tax=Rotaria socialis TaxID=392032 RepID=A0A818B1A4_9BILA|nr:unnamed protein product [Rotaria socialis]CAF4338075.1 unnamed protein product [Rotaria socialis]